MFPLQKKQVEFRAGTDFSDTHKNLLVQKYSVTRIENTLDPFFILAGRIMKKGFSPEIYIKTQN